MLKLAVSVLALVLAGTASAAGWRSMRIDASSEHSLNESVVAFREKLPRVRRAVFERSLQDIWAEGIKAAQADGRDYTVTDYLRDVDGLGYKEVVEFTDPTGKTADRYWDQAHTSINGARAAPRGRAHIPARNAGVVTYSGSQILDAGQAARSGGSHHY